MHLKYISSTRIFSSRFTKIFLLFCACAFIGSSIGKIVSHNTARQTAASAQSSNWGLSFQEEGKRPTGNASMEELKKYNSEDVYVIGGESIYRQLLPYCTKAYVTKIDHAYDADTYFPDLDADPEWEMTKISDEQTYFDLEYVFVIYERR